LISSTTFPNAPWIFPPSTIVSSTCFYLIQPSLTFPLPVISSIPSTINIRPPCPFKKFPDYSEFSSRSNVTAVDMKSEGMCGFWSPDRYHHKLIE
jgi:hypothetical protein